MGHRGSGWIKLKGGQKYLPITTEFCGIKQRWLIVHSHKAYHKEKTTFLNRLHERENDLYRIVGKLKKHLFKDKDEALKEARKIRKAFPYHKVKTEVVPYYEGFISSDTRYMALQGYEVKVTHERDIEKIMKAKNRKGKFIIATNIRDWEKTDLQIIEAYQRRNANIESCFRQIKSAQFLGKGIYFKNVKRIQAYMSIVALALFINNIGQLIIRKGLTSTKQTIKNFAGKKIKNPTFAMISKLLRRVQILKIKTGKMIYKKVIELDEDLVKVINILVQWHKKSTAFHNSQTSPLVVSPLQTLANSENESLCLKIASHSQISQD